MAATAPVPRLIRFAGAMKPAAGQPASAVTGVTFSIYASKNGGAPLWTETQNVRADGNGRYDVLLGSTKATGVPAEIFTGEGERWLGVRLEGQEEQARTLLVSVPYAMKAAEAETLAGHSASEFVTSDKLTTVVQQQIQQQSGTTPGVKNTLGAKGNIVTNPATNFTDSTSDQVVMVTQNGTGSGLIATAVSNYAIQAKSTSGTGLFATSAGNAAINATNTSTTGTAYGAFGSTASVSGIGFRGTASAGSGNTSGVMGDSASVSGTGVYGTANATTGSAGVGVYGRSAGDSGIGVKATAASATGATTGILSTVLSPTGTSLILRNTASGKLLSGQAGGSNTEVFSVDGAGNLTGAKGTFTAPNIGVLGNSGPCPVPLSGVSSGVVGCSNGGLGVYGFTGSMTLPAGNFHNDSSGPILAGDGADGGFTIDHAGDFHTTGTIASDQSISATGLSVTGNVGVSGNSIFFGSMGMAGPLGVGTAAPRSTLELSGYATKALGPALTLTNTASGNGSAVALDFNPIAPSTTGTYNPELRLAAEQGGASTADWVFYGNNGGSLNAGLSEIMRISGFWHAVSIHSAASPGAALYVQNTYAYNNDEQAIVGESDGVGGMGVQGIAKGSKGTGVAGLAAAGGTAVYGFAPSGTALAASFDGDAQISNDLGVFHNLHVYGTLSKAAGSFKIDHPLDPENKYLSHSFVESPDMMNIYNGLIQLDRKGEAWVTLPDYFEALNQDFRYQLTAIGKPAPKLYVAKEIDGNRFKISGGPANGKVSWQVTGIRHDAYAQRHRIAVEEEKPETQRGKYLNPDVFGAGEDQRIAARNIHPHE